MLQLRMSAFLVIAVSLLSAGCSGGLKNENAALRQQNQELQARLSDSERALRSAPDPSQLQRMQNEIAQREARIRELESQLRTLEPGGDPGIAGIQTSYDRRRGELTVNLPADILFPSGSNELKPTSKATLDKVVAALRRDYPGKHIRVEGHTDSDPILRTRGRWVDNLDLSLNRAASVSRYMAEKGLDARLITTSGLGSTRPKASKPASRRVEIVVLVG
jgi:chemotaxis protein MotB